MAELNLDARRDEFAKEPNKVTLMGKEWELPAVFPLVVAQYLATGQIDRAVEALFGDGYEVIVPTFSDEDLNNIMSELYGMETPTAVVSGNGKSRASSRKAVSRK